jgi:serine/threonine protein phosphatase 1
VPPGTRLYVVGDIHGCKVLLDQLLAGIVEDAAGSAAARRVVVFLGDYIDRGPDARQVVDTLMAGPPASWPGFQWVCLKGNHEDAMLRFLADQPGGAAWLVNGGISTAESYLREEPGDSFDWAGLRRHMSHALPETHRVFLSGLPLWHIEGDYCLVHAGLKPRIPLEAQSPADLLWIRDEFLASPVDHGRLVVHGHTPTWSPDVRPNRIGIDTAAFATGRLTALVAEGDEAFFLSTESSVG